MTGGAGTLAKQNRAKSLGTQPRPFLKLAAVEHRTSHVYAGRTHLSDCVDTLWERRRTRALFGCAARVCGEQVDLSRNHVRVQSILAVNASFREAGEEATFVRVVSWSFHFSDIYG